MDWRELCACKGMLFIPLLMFYSCRGQERGATEQDSEDLATDEMHLDSAATVIYRDRFDHLWLASDEKGVYKYDGETLILFTSKEGLCNNRVLSVQEDQVGHLYFDTPSGICKYDGVEFSTLPVVESKGQAPSWKSESGDLWFRMGWDKSGPFRYDGENLYHLELPENKMEAQFYAKYPNASYNPYGIYSIFKDRKGNIWFGTSNLGVYLFDGQNLSWMYEKQWTETPHGGDFGIRSMAEDRDGNYWICNTNYRYTLLPYGSRSGELSTINFKRDIGIENRGGEALYFQSMVIDPNGDLLMVTFEEGIWHNNGTALIPFLIRDGDRDILPSSVYRDNKNTLWFKTPNDGIYHYDGTAFEKLIISGHRSR